MKPRRRNGAGILRLCGEVLSNLRARLLLASIVAVTVAAGLIGTFISETNTTASTRAYQARLTRSGYVTLYLGRSQLGGGIAALTASTCTQLKSLPGVRAVAWLRAATPIHLFNSTGPQLSLQQAGGDIVKILAVSNPSFADRWTGEQLIADPASIAGHDSNPSLLRFAAPRGPHQAAATTALLSILGDGLRGSVLTVTQTTGDVDLCAILTTLTSRNDVHATVAASFPPTQHYEVRWAMAGADQLDNPTHRFTIRPSQYTWLACVILCLTTWMLYLRIRRPERAFYAIVGVNPTKLRILTMLEGTLLTAAGLVIGSAVLLISTRRRHLAPDILNVAIAAAERSAIAVVLTTLAYASADAAHTKASVLSILKDR